MPRSGATEDLGGGAQAAITPVVVEVIDGPSKGTSIPLRKGSLVVGKHSDCDLVLKDPSVSSRHLALELGVGAVHLHDLGSLNGTFYLGARVTDANVPVGGTLTL